MSSWSSRDDAGFAVREAIAHDDRIGALRILSERHGYDWACEVLRLLAADVEKRSAEA